MKRVLGWQGRYSKCLAEARRQPYNPGTFDCAIFAANVVEALTGVDLAADFRGKYVTVEEGIKLINQAGYIDYIDMVRAYFPSDRPDRARIGDLASVYIGESMPALGAVAGSRVYLLSERGMGVIGLLDRRGEGSSPRFVTEIFKVS